MADWLTGSVEFPERIHYTAMTADLISRITTATKVWADDWLDRSDSWEQTGTEPTNAAQAHAVIAELRDHALSSLAD